MNKSKILIMIMTALCVVCIQATAFADRTRDADFSQYTQTYSTDGDVLVVTNNHTPETIDITGGINWDDNSNQDNLRPENVTIQLFNGDDAVAGKSQIISSTDAASGNANKWEYEFSSVPKYQNQGQEIVYTVQVTSAEPDGYTYTFDASVDPNFTTGTHSLLTTSLPFEVLFSDEDNRDGVRPETVTIQLYQNGEPYGDPITVGEGDDWDDIFNNLPQNVAGEVGTPATYTADAATTIPGYTSAFNATDGTITLTHITDLRNVTVRKDWNDANDQDGIRSDSVCIVLNGDTVPYSIQLNASNAVDDNTWEYTFTNVHVNNAGNRISYSIEETGETCASSSTPTTTPPTLNQSECEAANYTWVSAVCSDAAYDNQSNCEAANEIWTEAQCVE